MKQNIELAVDAIEFVCGTELIAERLGVEYDELYPIMRTLERKGFTVLESAEFIVDIVNMLYGK